MPASDVLERLRSRGVKQFVYSNVDRDGMLGGIDLDEVRTIAQVVRGRFLYSGGIGTLDDLKGLVELRQVNLGGVIVGKALYEKRFTIADAHAVLDAK
jgi:phosphoribosylformimino-5-aminoimidazole carboxamide ribotide isomerase